MSIVPPSRSNAFAFLFPLYDDATELLKVRDNKRLLQTTEYLSPSILAAQRDCRTCPYYIKLDYTLLFSRPYISFGWSRSNHIQFERPSDVA